MQFNINYAAENEVMGLGRAGLSEKGAARRMN